MSSFCGNCGSAIPAHSPFCGGCGHKTGIVNVPATTPSGKSFNPALKIVLVIVGFFALCAVLGTAALFYTAHRAEKKAAEIGFNLAPLLEKAASEKDEETPKAAKDACALLTKQEVEQATGTFMVDAVAHSEGSSESSCTYTPATEGAYPVELKVDWENGKAAIAAIQGLVPKMMPGTENNSNLGDATLYGPMDSMLYVLKGDKLVSFGFGLSPITREGKNALAAKVLGKL